MEKQETKSFKPYSVVCKVTGLTKKTNPKQFQKTADLVGVTGEVLHGSYVSREGKKVLVESGMTAPMAADTYGLDPVVAAWVLPVVEEVEAEVEASEVSVD